MKVSCAFALLSSSLAVSTDASTIYADQVCVENNIAGDISFSVHDTSSGATVGSYGNYPVSQTHCSALSSTPGTNLQLKVSAYWGRSETINPEFQFGSGCTINFKCAGTVDSYTCQLQNYCTPAPTKAPTSNDCVDPVLSDVTYTDATFEAQGLGATTTTCNNTDGHGTLSCTAQFSVTQTASETVTASSTDTIGVTGTITFKESVGVVEATQSVAVTYSGSYTEGHSKTTSKAISITSTCATTLPAGECAILQGTYVIGTLQAKWQGTMTCADGRQISGYGILSAENAVSEAEITNCYTQGCHASNTFLHAVESQKSLRGAGSEQGSEEVTYYDQFCVDNAMANDVHFYVYDSANTQVASYGDFPVGQTKCVWLTSTLNPDNGMYASIVTDCWLCHDQTSTVPTFSYKPGANKQLIYECYGTEWNIACTKRS